MKLEVTATELQTSLCILHIFIFIYPSQDGTKEMHTIFIFCWRLLSLARLLPIISIYIHICVPIHIYFSWFNKKLFQNLPQNQCSGSSSVQLPGSDWVPNTVYKPAPLVLIPYWEEEITLFLLDCQWGTGISI